MTGRPIVELRILLQAARRSAIVMASAALLCAIVAAVAWNFLPAGYRASSVLVLDSTAVTYPGQAAFSGDPERYVSGELEALRSYPVITRAATNLHPAMSPQALLASIDVTHVTGSDVVEVTGRASTPQRASAVANAVATSYVERREEAAQRSLDQQRNALEDQAAQIGSRLAAGQLPDAVSKTLYATLAQINTSLSGLMQPGLLHDTTRVLDAARNPVSARPLGLLPAVGVAALLGALGVLAVSVVRTLRDPRVAGRDEIESLSGQPVSAVFPHVRHLSTMGPEAWFDRLATPAARLIALTRVDAAESVPVVIAVCSATSPAGCSTVSAALALGLAREGLRVTAVTGGADLPSSPMLDSNVVPSLSAVRPAASVVPRPADRGWQSAEGAVPGLTVTYRSGGAHLTADDFAKALAEAPGADVVVVDASSVLDSSFAGAAVRESDRVVLVVPALHQPESDLRLAVELLGAADATVRVVVTHP
jgi:capsular polysaccharide biosynthesis protein